MLYVWAFTLQAVGLFTLRVTELSRLQATLSASMLTLKTDIERLTSDGWRATRGSRRVLREVRTCPHTYVYDIVNARGGGEVTFANRSRTLRDCRHSRNVANPSRDIRKLFYATYRISSKEIILWVELNPWKFNL